MIQYTDLSKPIYEKLKKMISQGELKPGDKIVQEKIAENLGVSRTPLMKALLMLENEFIVESIPRRGMYIKDKNAKELIDIYICREALEGMAARLLALRQDENDIKELYECFAKFKGQEVINVEEYTVADERFHKLLIELTKNKPLDVSYFYGNIHNKVIGHGLVRPPEETLQEHFDIIDAITRGDEDKAEYYARIHIQKSREII